MIFHMIKEAESHRMSRFEIISNVWMRLVLWKTHPMTFLMPACFVQCMAHISNYEKVTKVIYPRLSACGWWIATWQISISEKVIGYVFLARKIWMNLQQWHTRWRFAVIWLHLGANHESNRLKACHNSARGSAPGIRSRARHAGWRPAIEQIKKLTRVLDMKIRAAWPKFKNHFHQDVDI